MALTTTTTSQETFTTTSSCLSILARSIVHAWKQVAPHCDALTLNASSTEILLHDYNTVEQQCFRPRPLQLCVSYRTRQHQQQNHDHEWCRSCSGCRLIQLIVVFFFFFVGFWLVLLSWRSTPTSSLNLRLSRLERAMAKSFVEAAMSKGRIQHNLAKDRGKRRRIAAQANPCSGIVNRAES